MWTSSGMLPESGVLPAEMGWSDLGSWEALARLKADDAEGNQTFGNAYLMAARNSQARSDGPLVAARLLG